MSESFSSGTRTKEGVGILLILLLFLLVGAVLIVAGHDAEDFQDKDIYFAGTGVVALSSFASFLWFTCFCCSFFSGDSVNGGERRAVSNLFNSRSGGPHSANNFYGESFTP